MFSSIRVRLTLSHLAVIVLAMGLSGFLLLSFLERYFLETMEDSLVAQARITAQALIPGAVPAGPPVETQAPAYNTVQQRQGNLALQTQNLAPPPADEPALDLGYLADVTFQLSTELETRIRILDNQGRLQVDSQTAEVETNLSADPLVAQALAGRYASRVDNEAMHLALPVYVENRLLAIVYLSQPLRDVTAVLHDLRNRWLLSTAIALLLSAGIGLVLSRAIAQPLRRLTAAAAAVAEGQLDQQVPVAGGDELGRLSLAFNEMTQRLKTARQMQLDMVANVSHELRTPITSIKGLVETLRNGAVDDPEVRDDFLATVEHETDRLIRLINDLLLLSRVDSLALRLAPEPLELRSLAQTAVGRLTPQAEARRVSLHLEEKADAPSAWGDRDRIEQVLVNLLDNAIKYSRPGGMVTISLGDERSEGNESVRVEVRDEGIGIPAEDLARLGERFYRADKARSRAEGGSGLGLAIARSLVEAHGGRLWLNSEEGRGTLVTFTLPRA
ncbi:MAG: ATP-binding protein [Chloroflexota bacterium]